MNNMKEPQETETPRPTRSYLRRRRRCRRLRRLTLIVTFLMTMIMTASISASQTSSSSTSTSTDSCSVDDPAIPLADTIQPQPQPSFLVLSTVDGSIWVLDASTGMIQSMFSSGLPLVGASSSLGRNNRRIVPGLDGRLYISSELSESSTSTNEDDSQEDDEHHSDEDDPQKRPLPPNKSQQPQQLQPLAITVFDVLENPIRTCSTSSNSNSNSNSNLNSHPQNQNQQRQQSQPQQSQSQEECGLLTATKATSLFALDTRNGGLTWYQDPNGTTRSASSTTPGTNDGTTTTPGSTVLLQRQDVLVKQISTDSGEQVWNVTLGTLQALDFAVSHTPHLLSTSLEDSSWLLLGAGEEEVEDEGMKSYETDDDDDDDDKGSWTTTTTPDESSSSETTTTPPIVSLLPSVLFGPDGTSLAAIDPLHPSRILWKRTFETVVASAFGLNDNSWKSLNVLEDDTMMMRMMMNDDNDVVNNKYNTNDDDDGTATEEEEDDTIMDIVVQTDHGLIPLALPSPSWRDRFRGWSASLSPSSSPSRLPTPSRFWTDVHRGGGGGGGGGGGDFGGHPRWLLGGRSGGGGDSSESTDVAVIRTPTWQNVLDAKHMYIGRFREQANDLLGPLGGGGGGAPGTREQMQQKMMERYEPVSTTTTTTTTPSQQQQHEPTLQQHVQQLQHTQNQKEQQRSSQATMYSQYNYHYHRQTYPLLLPSPSSVPSDRKSHMLHSAEGIFLTWKLVTAVVVVVVTVCGLGLRWFYLKKKNQWLQLLARATANSVDPATSPSTDTLPSDSVPTNHVPILEGSPDTSGGVVQSNTSNIHDANGDGVGVAATAAAPSSTTMVPAGVQSASLSSSTQQQKQQGVGMIDGIPLIQYSRYDSEFEETLALGKGGFGTVFRCKNALDGREYAIKKVFIRHRRKPQQQQQQPPEDEFARRLQRVLREVKILAVLDHPNIVRYYTAWLELEHGDDAEGKNQLSCSATPGGISDYYAAESTTRGFSRRFSSNNLLGLDGDDMSSSTLERSMISADMRWGYQNQAPSWDPSGAGNHFDHHNDTSHVDMDDLGFTFDRGDDSEEDEDDDDDKDNDFSSPPPESSICKTSPNWHSKAQIADLEGKNLQCISEINGPDPHHEGFFTSPTAGQQCVTSFSVDASKQQGFSNPTPTQSTRQHLLEESREQESQTISSPAPLLVRHTLYIQMQLCSEQTLADFLSNKKARRGSSGAGDGDVDIPYALSLFVQIAQGVQHVHGRGLIHRDLKPNNCFIDNSGVVKVGDFGLSRESGDRMDEENDLSALSQHKPPALLDDGENTAGVGTRSYASPEQMKGSDYDSSTDVYSLGLILFELCYPMYTGMERLTVFGKLRDQVFPDQWLATIKPAFPKLHIMLKSMISNRPSERPSAEEIARAVQSILEEYTIQSLDKQHQQEGSLLLRVEGKPREDVLRHTMKLIKEAASPQDVEIVQYGLRGGTNKAIMEFAIRSSCPDEGETASMLGSSIVSKMKVLEDIILVRQVSASKPM